MKERRHLTTRGRERLLHRWCRETEKKRSTGKGDFTVGSVGSRGRTGSTRKAVQKLLESLRRWRMVLGRGGLVTGRKEETEKF